jgi:hypothetical protein
MIKAHKGTKAGQLAHIKDITKEDREDDFFVAGGKSQ